MRDATGHTVAILKAIAIHGSTHKDFARSLGVHNSLVSHWLSGRTKVTPIMAKNIEMLTHGQVLREDLLPEIFDRSWPIDQSQQDAENARKTA